MEGQEQEDDCEEEVVHQTTMKQPSARSPQEPGDSNSLEKGQEVIILLNM